MTSTGRWQPFQDLGEHGPHDLQDGIVPELDLMRALLARAVGRGGDRHAVDPDGRPAWAPALDISERRTITLPADVAADASRP